jgi:hypothetical protein
METLGLFRLWRVRGKRDEWAVPVRERRGWRLKRSLTCGSHPTGGERESTGKRFGKG